MKPETRGDPADMELSREPSKSHQESERVTRDSAGVEKTGEDSVEYCEPGKTHAKSQTREEPWESHREPQGTQPESGSKKKDSGESCETGKTHAKSWTREEPGESPREPPESQNESRSQGKDSAESCEPGRTHDES